MSDYTNWHVGMKVVCVKEGAWSPPMKQADSYPVYGGVYTIREINLGNDEKPYLTFEEIRNAPVYRRGDDMHEAWFAARQFRPVQKRKTDISIFRRLLTHPRVTIGEDA